MSKNKIKDGFSDIEKSEKTIWRADQFGKRVVEDIDSFRIKLQVDNQVLSYLHLKNQTQPIKNAQKRNDTKNYSIL